MGITQHSLEALLFAARASSIALIDSVKSVASVSQRVSPFSRHVTRDDCNKREREREGGRKKTGEKKNELRGNFKVSRVQWTELCR